MLDTVELMNVMRIVGTVLTAISAIVGVCAYRNTKKSQRAQMIAGIFERYSSTEIGEAVKALWDLWRQCGGNENDFRNSKVQEEFVRKYCEAYSNNSDGSNSNGAYTDSLHNQRRIVSNFYQRMAFVCHHDRATRKLFYKLWTKRDLEIIPEIIEPIEMFGLQQELHGEILSRSKYPKDMIYMLDLYKHAR